MADDEVPEGPISHKNPVYFFWREGTLGRYVTRKTTAGVPLMKFISEIPIFYKVISRGNEATYHVFHRGSLLMEMRLMEGEHLGIDETVLVLIYESCLQSIFILMYTGLRFSQLQEWQQKVFPLELIERRQAPVHERSSHANSTRS